ncbi:MAG: EAL domain-containing protein [Alphaproteobacteria bacterium]
MSFSRQSSYQQLCRAFFDLVGPHHESTYHGPPDKRNFPEKMDVQTFGDALTRDLFKKRYIKPEPIYTQGGILAYEALSRPEDNEGKTYSIGPVTKMAYDLGLAEEVDSVLCSNALTVAINNPDKTPVTLNMSVQSVLSLDFWNRIEPKMERLGFHNIISEILEHDVALDADISYLEELKRQELRFALDDLSTGEGHGRRLEVFGDLVDFVKIDGPLVRAYFEGEYTDEEKTYTRADFEGLIEKVAAHASHAKIIAERVYNKEEAQKLFEIGITGVQGWHLKDEDFVPILPKGNVQNAETPTVS